MSNDLALFEGDVALPVSEDQLAEYLARDKELSGSYTDNYRISIKGGRFRLMFNGEQQAVSKHDSMDIVIVNSAPIARTYFKDAYDPDAAVRPTCWSVDTEKPSADVPSRNRQATTCRDCKQNIKGSGQNDNSRACRFSQRLAIVMDGFKTDETPRVYQIQLPATSVFGKAEDGKLPMQAYGRILQERKTPSIMLVTTMYFDENSETPKLFFKPKRFLTRDEFLLCEEASKSEAAHRAVTLLVSQTDDNPEFEIEGEPPVVEKKSEEPKVEETTKEPDPAPEVEEPKKRTSSKATEEAPKDLASLADYWDD